MPPGPRGRARQVPCEAARCRARLQSTTLGRVTGRAGVVLASTFVATVAAGCSGDKSENITVTGTLAVGAYANLSFGDACAGSKANLCSHETVDAVDSITVDPPGALEVLSPSDVPTEVATLWTPSGMYVVHGLSPARATVCVQARYSDGTHRKACAPVDVDTVTHVATWFSCDTGVDSRTAAPLVPAGATLRLGVQLSASDGTALGGVLAHPIDDAQLTPYGWMGYLWHSPAAGGALTIGSRLDRLRRDLADVRPRAGDGRGAERRSPPADDSGAGPPARYPGG